MEQSKKLVYRALCLALSLMTVSCVNQPLPEAESSPAILYVDRCGICHPAYHPQVHNYTGWNKVIVRMEKHADTNGIKPFLSKEEKAAILYYLEKNARKGF